MLVKIRDKTYESVRHAANAFGVSKFAIYAALNRGTIDRVGLAPTQRKPIVLNGLSFRSLGDASVQLGFNRSFIRWSMISGSQKSAERLNRAIAQYKQDRGMPT